MFIFTRSLYFFKKESFMSKKMTVMLRRTDYNTNKVFYSSISFCRRMISSRYWAA